MFLQKFADGLELYFILYHCALTAAQTVCYVGTKYHSCMNQDVINSDVLRQSS